MHLSDVGLSSIRKDKSIEVEESNVGPEWNMSEDWTLGRKINQRDNIRTSWREFKYQAE